MTLLFRILLIFSLPAATPGFGQSAADPALEILQTANALYNRGLHAPAREQFQLFLDRHGEHPRADEARMGRALTLLGEGETDEAIDTIRELANDKSFARREEMRRMLAGLLLRRGDLNAARDEARSLARDTVHEETREQAKQIWSEAAYRLEDWKDAAEAADPPSTGRMRYQLGLARLRSDDTKGGVEAVKPLAEGDGPYAHPAAWLAAATLRETDPDRARELFRRAAYENKGPHSPDAGWAAARLAWSSDDAKATEELLREFLKSFPEHPARPEARLLLGRAHERRNDTREARKAYGEALDAEPVRHQAAVRLLRLLKNDSKERKLRERALGWEPEPVWTPYLLLAEAEADMEEKRFGEAEENLHSLARNFAGHDLVPEARRRRIDALDRADRPAEAAAAAREFARAYPENPDIPAIRLREAGLWVRAERNADARKRLESLIADAPGGEISTPARLLLAQLRAAEEDWAGIPELLKPLREEGEGEELQGEARQAEALRLSGLAAAKTREWSDVADWLGAYLEKADDKDDTASIRLTLASALEADGKPGAAAGQLDRFVQNRPKDERAPELLLKSAQLHLIAEQPDEAERRLKRVADDYKDSSRAPDALAELARLARAAEDAERASEWGLRLLKEHPKHDLAAAAGLQAGQLWFQRENFGKARETLELLLKHHAGHESAEQASFLLAMTFLDEDKIPEAAERIEDFLKTWPDSPRRPRALYELAWLRREQDRVEASVVSYRRLLADFPDHDLESQARLELAELLRNAGQPEKALSALEGADEANPRVRLERAWILFQTGENGRAGETFAEVASELEDPAAKRDAWFQAGEAAMRGKDFSAALERFERAAGVEEAEATAPPRLRLAEAYGLNGRWRESARAARRLQTEFLDHDLTGRAVYQEAWALENQGKYAEAIERYRSWVETGDKSPTAARCQFQIGECLLALDRTDAAIAAFMQTVVAHDVPEVRAPALLELADTLRNAGRPEEAREWYQTLLKEYPDSSAADLAREPLESPPTE